MNITCTVALLLPAIRGLIFLPEEEGMGGHDGREDVLRDRSSSDVSTILFVCVCGLINMYIYIDEGQK